jgi:hypothetical protein
MNDVIITRSQEAEASLAELAVRINTEHGQVEAAVRDGLLHARQADTLLLQVKSRLPHGSWLPWLQANCQVTPRQSQRYIRINERWDELMSQGGQELGLKGALKLLARHRDDAAGPNATPVLHLPAPPVYYRDQNLLNDEALCHLLKLADDYGPEVLCPLIHLRPNTPPVVEMKEVWWFFNDTRPLDHPTLWPFPLPGDPDIHAVVAAVQLFFEDGRTRGGVVPQWEFIALWFASRAVWLAEKFSWSADRIAATLQEHLGVWREHFRTALVFVSLGEHFLKSADGPDLYWGYRSDLRHAGAIREAEAMFATKDAATYPGLWKSWLAGHDDMDRAHQADGYLLPSCKQGRLDPFLVDSDEGDADPENPDPARTGEAAPGPADGRDASQDTEAKT